MPGGRRQGRGARLILGLRRRHIPRLHTPGCSLHQGTQTPHTHPGSTATVEGGESVVQMCGGLARQAARTAGCSVGPGRRSCSRRRPLPACNPAAGAMRCKHAPSGLRCGNANTHLHDCQGQLLLGPRLSAGSKLDDRAQGRGLALRLWGEWSTVASKWWPKDQALLDGRWHDWTAQQATAADAAAAAAATAALQQQQRTFWPPVLLYSSVSSTRMLTSSPVESTWSRPAKPICTSVGSGSRLCQQHGIMSKGRGQPTRCRGAPCARPLPEHCRAASPSKPRLASPSPSALTS